MGWLWSVILCTCVVVFLMLKETVCLMEAVGIGLCALDRVSKQSAISPFLHTDQKVQGEKLKGNSSVLRAQLSTKRECCGCCWSCQSSASPVPALGVTLVTRSSLPDTASPAAPCPVPAPVFSPLANTWLAGSSCQAGMFPRNGSSSFNSLGN